MAIIKCPECEHEVSTKAKTCPNCGYRLKKVNFVIVTVALIIVAFLIGVIVIFNASYSGVIIGFSNATNRGIAKSKFDVKKNSSIVVHGWEFSVPKCFGEGVSTENQVTYQLEEAENEGAILIFAAVNVDDYDSNIAFSAIGDEVFKKYSPRNTSYHSLYVSGIDGNVIDGKAFIDNKNMEFKRFDFYNNQTNSMIMVFLAQTYETKYNYISDFEKIINSMKKSTDENSDIHGEEDTNSLVGKEIIVSEPITVRAEPKTDSVKIGSAYRGDEYIIMNVFDEWYQIDYKGQQGFVRVDVVTVK